MTGRVFESWEVRSAKSAAAKAATVAAVSTVWKAAEPEREWWTGELIDPPETAPEWPPVYRTGGVFSTPRITSTGVTSTGGWCAPTTALYDFWGRPRRDAELGTTLDDDT